MFLVNALLISFVLGLLCGLTRHGKLVNARIGAHFCNALNAKLAHFRTSSSIFHRFLFELSEN